MNPDRRWLAIVNPVAGRGTGARIAGGLAAELAAAGISSDVVQSPGPGEAARLASTAVDDGYSVVLAVGGDGTANEVANGIAGTAALLALYPVGTGNDLARTLGYPRRRRDLAAFVARAREREVDAGLVNGRVFVNHVGVGIDGVVADLARGYVRYLGGRAGYVAAGIAGILSYAPVPMTITVDGQVIAEGPQLMVVAANGRWFGGGMQCAPAAEPDDGWLEIVAAGPLRRADAVRTMLRTYRGTHIDGKRVRAIRGRSLEVTLDREVSSEADGEVTRVRALSVSLRPRALRVLA